MPVKKEIDDVIKDKPKKRSGAYAKNKGNAYERQIAGELRDIGFTGCVTSRSESKSTDDMKIDIFDKEGTLPCYIQLKKTQNTPSYAKISDECGLKDKPFVLIWNMQEKKEVNCVSKGEVAMIPKKFFYELLKGYINNLKNE